MDRGAPSFPSYPSFGRLAVLGVGYMGGSLALAARRSGVVGEVVGYDSDPAVAAVAEKRGIVNRMAASPRAAAAGAAVVVLSAPVRSITAMVADIAPAVADEALVFDIGSVKGPLARAVDTTPLAARFVGCHPLAGTEVSGAVSADADLYSGKPCIVCPGPRTSHTAIDGVVRFWEGIGASIIRMDPEEHDAFMAAASHLPHVASFALAGSLAGVADMLEAKIPPSAPPTSLRDTTRVAASNPIMWRDIFLENRAHLLPLVRELEHQVSELRVAIEKGDAASAQRLLEIARACRKRLVKPR
jgi:cyclohexadieny/prephenate dehydrogenase